MPHALEPRPRSRPIPGCPRRSPSRSEEREALLDVARTAVAVAVRGDAVRRCRRPRPPPGVRPARRRVRDLTERRAPRLRRAHGCGHPGRAVGRRSGELGRRGRPALPERPSLGAGGPALEVSVLGPLVSQSDPTRWRLGVDGIVVERWGRRGLLLPEVGPMLGNDRKAMLETACRKAGLPPGAWRDRGPRCTRSGRTGSAARCCPRRGRDEPAPRGREPQAGVARPAAGRGRGAPQAQAGRTARTSSARRLGERGERRQVGLVQGDVQRTKVGLKMGLGHRAGQDDVHPRVREHRARAAASGATPWRAATASSAGEPCSAVASRPFASASLTTRPTRVVRLAQRGGRRRLEGFQVAWTQPNGEPAPSRSIARAAGSRRPGGALVDIPTTMPDARSPASSSSTASSARTPLSSVAEWTWYRRSHGSSSSRLAAAGAQHGPRVVLHLVDLGPCATRPRTRTPTSSPPSPRRAPRPWIAATRRGSARRSVGARDVEVPDAGGVGASSSRWLRASMVAMLRSAPRSAVAARVMYAGRPIAASRGRSG